MLIKHNVAVQTDYHDEHESETDAGGGGLSLRSGAYTTFISVL